MTTSERAALVCDSSAMDPIAGGAEADLATAVREVGDGALVIRSRRGGRAVVIAIPKLSPRVLLVVLAAALVALAMPVAAEDVQTPDPPALHLDNKPLDSPLALPPEPPPEPGAHGGGQVLVAEGVSPSDDRQNSTPTAWYIWAHQTPAQVTAFVNTGFRLVDIHVEATSPSYLFTSTYVANTGSYQKTWWWYYGVTGATLSSALSTNNARLISFKANDIGGGDLRFTAIMIRNTGTDGSVWWWYYNATAADISSLVAANQARLTQIHAYVIGGVTRYAVVMVDNTGGNGTGWWWYYNVTPATVAWYLQNNGARLVDMDKDPNSGNFNVIMYSCGADCPYWWWYYGVGENWVVDTANQAGARIIDITSYPGCGGTCYDMVLINNSNALTTRVGEMLRDGTDGTKGLYLEQVGGSVLASLMSYWPFEPASTLKVGPHLYALKQVQDDPGISLSTPIPWYQAPSSGTCPGNTVIGSESIQIADREMMWHSDNTRTREIVDYFGVSSINSTMAGIGMADTSINHVFGCGGPTPNQTTLNDLATLYRRVVNGSELDPTHRDIFFNQMAGTGQFLVEGYDWTGLVATSVPALIEEEATPAMSTAFKQNFANQTYLAYKAGNYKLCTSGGCSTYIDHISIFGYASIPFCDAGGPRDFAFGVFINNSTSDATSSATFNATKAELLREQIHDGLALCFQDTIFQDGFEDP